MVERPSDPATTQPPAPFEFLGFAEIATGTRYGDTEIGGLSALVYLPEEGIYLALSDDRSEYAPARFYSLAIDLSDGRLDAGDVEVNGVTTLRSDGQPFPRDSIDPEGLAWVPGRGLYVSSEGDTRAGVAPFVRLFSRAGEEQEALPVPTKFLPDGTGERGIRFNLGFEALTYQAETDWLWVGTENALVQDGPAADVGRPSRVRLLGYDLAAGGDPVEHAYRTEPVVAAAVPADALRTAGLVELVALEGHRFLALERSFSVGVGTTVRCYLFDLAAAVDVRDDGLVGAAVPVKTLVLDLGDFGVPMDNLEGIALGPPLADGRDLMVVISDNNFSAEQRTLIMAFALDRRVLEEW